MMIFRIRVQPVFFMLCLLLCYGTHAQRQFSYDTAFSDGSTLSLVLDDQDFAAPLYDGSLNFSGSYTTADGHSFPVTLQTSTGALHEGISTCKTTVFSNAQALALTNDSQWASLTTVVDGGANGPTVTEVSTSTHEFGFSVIEGDYSDLLAVLPAQAQAIGLELAMTQTLATLVSERASCGADDPVTFNQCFSTASAACGSFCISSFDYIGIYDADGNLVNASCAFTCKDNCGS